MTSVEQVRKQLENVVVPVIERNIISLNLVKNITLDNDKLKIQLAAAALDEPILEYVDAGIRASMAVLKIKDVEIEHIITPPAELNQIKYVIAIMSGKGGVGKSSVSSLLAISLKRMGWEVGIMDADITGSSIPRMFGIINRPSGSDNGLLPVASESGISIMSMNLLLGQEDDAVIWRAPLLSSAIKQFWTDVLWGKLDYMIIDLPPGTADAPLTVLQTLPVTGIILVFTPQGLVEMIVKKAVNMAQKMEKQVLGVVENMSYFEAPETKQRYEIFGNSKGEAMARTIGAPLLAKLPIDPELSRLCDAGKIEEYQSPVVAELGNRFLKSILELPEAHT
jgi:ATP-binding protein involved in chromosome partitioning